MILFEFIETAQFKNRRKQRLTDEEERVMQHSINREPTIGNVLSQTGGFRKLRVATKGRGKSGSVRVVYYSVTKKDQILLGTVFNKNEKGNISDAEKVEMRKVAQLIK